MKLSITFTPGEMSTIIRALNVAFIHLQSESEAKKCDDLFRKIKLIHGLNAYEEYKENKKK